MSRYIYGIHPALETLKATPEQVEQIFLLLDGLKGPLAKVAQAARGAGISLENASPKQLERLAGGKSHQGVVLRVAPFIYADLADIIERATAKGEQALILVLDEIEDPHNLGALIRSGLAMGAHGVVIPKDRAATIGATVVKTSAGASAHLPVAQVTNLSRALEEMKSAGIWVVAADMSGDRTPETTDFLGHVALVVGNEGHGIRRLILEKSDFRVRIPIAKPMASLNASVAGAILLYEAARQRRVQPR